MDSNSKAQIQIAAWYHSRAAGRGGAGGRPWLLVCRGSILPVREGFRRIGIEIVRGVGFEEGGEDDGAGFERAV